MSPTELSTTPQFLATKIGNQYNYIIMIIIRSSDDDYIGIAITDLKFKIISNQ